MKLRNKYTNEVVPDLEIGQKLHAYVSFADFCNEWEDAKFPFDRCEYFSLSTNGNIYPYRWDGTTGDRMRLELGNCFKSYEEAELAIKKLKSLKRLKDKGFKFVNCDWTKELTVSDIHIYADIDCEWSDLVEEDLQTVFGGEK